ncbi:Na(+)-translocating NADH-quinone reductase subunit C [Aeromonas cavernicola]|uniref:Na(+)-translocating NADH-quinone reductase subunit C n=1 Tax=Aeromonas cavernicola TaxID=1006623 RepID=A0A2H9U4T1_9GAMM|nr:Na(+)-translocating NADH-quinone reductase subunit C [Aeromonas cavernicola]PJG59046.1 Na(+)-translocating NADH-quinone reductase subunit C [Aeromonas cavernicola]
MAFNKDSTLGTIGVVTALCLACSIVVSVAAVGLRPAQQENKALDKQSNILAVAGVDISAVAKRDLAKLYGEKIEARLVDLATGAFVDGDADNFDAKLAAKDPAQSVHLTPADDKAGLRQISKRVPVFFAKDSAGKIDSIILPIYGQGLWSTMYAFVAVAADGQTIKGITYYDHGETPGLGGEIENPAWRALFVGKKLFDQNGVPSLRVIKGHAPAGSEHEIDGLSGATLTGNGVQNTFDFWMGAKGFGPFLAKVRAGEINNG